MKYSFAVTKKEVALPLQVAYDFQKSHWLLLVRFLVFSFQLVHIYAPRHYEIPAAPVETEPEYIKPTKAYADQRQKAKRNRRRKPKKATANLYQLS